MSLSRRRFRLVGPVLFYDLVCLARRQRYTALRILFPASLLLLLCLVYRNAHPARVFGGPNKYAMAEMAASFFYVFMLGQFLVALIFTPAYTAGAIAEEKDQHRLDFLLATDLRSQEIVLSKLLSRLANLMMLLLAGLPVLSFTQFWGGIDPDLVVAGYIAIGMTLISVAALSIYQSVHARKTRDAIVMTYLVVATYVGFSYAGQVLIGNPAFANYALIAGIDVTMKDIFRIFSAGNILVVQEELRETIKAGKPLSSVVPGLLRDYVLFHGILAFVCTLAAILQLRKAALHSVIPLADKNVRRLQRLRWLSVDRHPMLWKELCVEPGLTFNRAGKILVALMVLGSFLSGIWNAGVAIWDYWQVAARWGGSAQYWMEPLGRAVNAWVRQVGTIVACLTILGVAVRAAGSVSSERERQTLDSLLTTPIATYKMLWAKWTGSLWSVRWGFLWLSFIWALGICTGGLNLVVLPWLVLAWFVYAAFFATLGLWYSVRIGQTLAATVWTLIATAFLSIGHWLPWMIAGVPILSPGFGQQSNDWTTILIRLQAYGLTPPRAIGWLSFRGDHFEFVSSIWEDPWESLLAIIEGLVFWLAGAYFLFWNARRRFRMERM